MGARGDRPRLEIRSIVPSGQGKNQMDYSFADYVPPAISDRCWRERR
jgi:hypothetical protein